MSASSADDKQKTLTRRGFLKWTTALVAAGAAAVGVAGGYGSELLSRPNVEKTVTKTETQTSTATKTATATVTPPAQTITQTVTSTATSTTTAPPPTGPEVLLTAAHDTGPFIAHLVNGVWTKSTPIEPNLPVGHNAYAVRNRILAPDRVRFPMKRVDWDPSGNRNAANRGKSQYVRITWDQALTYVASELARIKQAYGPSGLCFVTSGHQWAGSLHVNGGYFMIGGVVSRSGWQSRFSAAYGGATFVEAESSYPGWDGGGAVITGTSAVVTNNAADILANTKLLIHWSENSAVTSYTGYRQNLYLKQFKDAGIKQILIDPYLNETGMVYCNQWIPIKPGTDEALMAAIAYVWITNNLHNQSFLATHTVGFDKFSAYILGTTDGTPKTPAWASAITGIDAATITSLANQWASQPTFVSCWSAATNRRDNGPNFVRMLITLCAMLGNFGKPGAGWGGGIGSIQYTSLPGTAKSPSSIPAGAADPVTQVIRHGQFADAILNPPISWTVARTPDGTIMKFQYPAQGFSPIHAVCFGSGSGRVLNQSGPTNDKIRAIQSPSIEFVYSFGPWWEMSQKFSDVILPVKHVGERDDIIAWENYIVYSHTVANPQSEAMNDMDILVQLAQKMGLPDITGGNTADQWLQQFFTAAAIPNMTYDQFKQVGYYKYDFPAQVPNVLYSSFNKDPVNNKLSTPSGLIEIYSQRVADAIANGTIDGLKETAIPTYIPGPENMGMSTTYPLYMTTRHPKFGRHSQWQNLTYHIDDPQMKVNGYQPIRMNPIDAQARGLQNGDVVRVFNDRGQILCGLMITNRLLPGVIQVQEGGWYAPQQPGVPGSLDLGATVNCLISGRSGSPITSGLIEHALVQAEKYKG